MKKQSKTIKLVIKSGVISSIYDDSLIGLMALGKASTKRASHVEPSGNNEWSADLSPVGGPVLDGFKTRESALKAEVAFLNKNVIA